MLDIDIRGKLFPSIEGMVISAIVIAILFLIVKKFFWSSISQYLEKRADYIQSHIEQAEKLATKAEEDYVVIENAKTDLAFEQKEIIDNARDYANKLSEKIISEAKAEAKMIVSEAKAEGEAYRTKIRHEIYTNIALRAAEKITELENCGQEEHPLLKEFLNKLEEL